MQPQIFSSSALILLLLASACATATTDPLNTEDESGGNNGSGGDAGSGGAPVLFTTGGSPGNSTLGGAPGAGGSDSTADGGSSAGGNTGAGGTTFTGACADEQPVGSISTTGDFGVFTCTEDRDSCKDVPLDEPALFECVSTHGPNCSSQSPQQGQNVWAYAGLCSEFGLGGASGN
jgi:hypothetical protein